MEEDKKPEALFLPDRMTAMIDTMIEAGYFRDRAEFIKHVVTEWMLNNAELISGIGAVMYAVEGEKELVKKEKRNEVYHG